MIRWSGIDPEALRQALQYIYTSKIELNNIAQTFELLAIAYELGLEELISIIEERALVSMNIDNVCYYLNYVITEIRHKINGKKFTFFFFFKTKLGRQENRAQN